MDKNPVTIVNSKVASDDLNKIRLQHADILMGMQNQAQKVAQFNQDRMMADKEKKSLDAQTNKDNIENIRKQQELDLKRMALMQ